MGFEKLKAQADAVRADTGEGIIEEGGLDSLRGCIGTPDQLRKFIREYEAAGVDELIFISQAGNNKHEHICESLELFAREVMPEFKERRPEVERAKRERLAAAVERIAKSGEVDEHPEIDIRVTANAAV